MFGSGVLEAALGLILIFLIFALFLTSLQEVLEIWLKTRAVTLEQGIRQLLHDPRAHDLVQRFYDQPLISALFQDDYAKAGRRALPSYIPTKLFVATLLDLEQQGVLNEPVKQVLAAARKAAQANGESLKARLELWYDSAMDRISGVYKRTTQRRVLAMAAVLSFGLNVNTLTIFQSLSQDEALRNAIVAQAEAEAKSALPQTDTKTVGDLRKRYGEIERLGLPIGWSERNIAIAREAFTYVPGTWGWARLAGSVLQLIAGWILTAVAISLGAPFWFDVLNKFMVLRATVKPTEKSPLEGSEDRQSKRAEPPAGSDRWRQMKRAFVAGGLPRIAIVISPEVGSARAATEALLERVLQKSRQVLRACRSVMGVSIALVLVGCAHLDTFAGPKPAFDLDKDLQQLNAQFGSATSIAAYYSQPETTERRDAFVAGRLTLYNLEYIRYVHAFTLDRATVESVFDITNLGVDLSTALVGRPYTKTVLGTASALLTGSHLSVEKNFLDEKTTAAVVSQMNANRKAALVPILAGLNRPVSEYPLSAAIIDLQSYYEAGTPEGALQAVQVEAAQQEAAANRKIEQYRTVSFSQDESSTAIRKWLYPAAATKSPSGQMLGPDGKPTPVDADRVTQLRRWMDENGWSDLPVQRLLDSANLAAARQGAVSDLDIPKS